jgi:hypothetical protein
MGDICEGEIRITYQEDVSIYASLEDLLQAARQVCSVKIAVVDSEASTRQHLNHDGATIIIAARFNPRDGEGNACGTVRELTAIAISVRNKAANGVMFTNEIDTSAVRDVPAYA